MNISDEWLVVIYVYPLFSSQAYAQYYMVFGHHNVAAEPIYMVSN